MTGGFTSQRGSNTENVSIWWRHHDFCCVLFWSGMGQFAHIFKGCFTDTCPIASVATLKNLGIWTTCMNPQLSRTLLLTFSVDVVFTLSRWTDNITTTKQNTTKPCTYLMIISRGVSGLATDSPCGVWGRGWTTCLLHDSPLFGSHFKMRVGM